MTNNTYAVIMAGGVGARFWPLSRMERPKQFLSVFGEQSLIEDTVDRLRKRIDPQRILIITNHLHEDRTRELFPWLPQDNIIGEPMGRNTAACVALAALILADRDPDARMIVLPADHFIGDEEEFLCTLERAISACRSGHLVTLGIQPTSPETGYGYIQHEAEELAPGIHPVRTFAEKPNYDTALLFLKSGDFLWNSGIFIWEVEAIIDGFERWLPDLWEVLQELRPHLTSPRFHEVLLACYQRLQPVSIDIGIMEPASRQKGKVRVIRASFPWNDVGTWAEVYRMRDKDELGNAVHSLSREFDKPPVIMIDSNQNLVMTEQRAVALVGIQKAIVIDTADALLVCHQDHHQDVRHVIQRLKEDGYHELL